MYLARMRLQNWRSYEAATFNFDRPRANKPIVLVGAMNGHGKTSFLLSLYLGIFGAQGLRYCEGFRGAFSQSGELPHYRRALEMYRRNTADSGEATEVEVEFKPTARDDSQVPSIRIIRRWHFTSANKAKQGDGFEELQVYVNDRVIPSTDLARAYGTIEKSLFPAHVTPAFIFDGEQAQSLIERSGEKGLREAVEVMFGSKILADAQDRLKTYIQRSTQKAGGKRRTSGLEEELLKLEAKREEENRAFALKQKEVEGLKHDVGLLNRERQDKMEELVRQGAGLGVNAEAAHKNFLSAEQHEIAVAKKLDDGVRGLALPLALTRLSLPILNRLKAEEALEAWENIKTGTLAKKEEVVQYALPEPPESDPLLGNLSESVRSQVRQRIIRALERIYNPPPPDSASEYILGHVRGDSRTKLSQLVSNLSRSDYDLRAIANEHRVAVDAVEEAKLKWERSKGLANPSLDAVRERITEINDEISNLNKRIGDIENEIRSFESTLKNLSTEIGRLREQLGKMEPEQKRLALAERTAQVIDELIRQLESTIGARLEGAITKHFLKIADQRFAKGKISLKEQGEPLVTFADGKGDYALGTASGFESRSFGVAFTLALAELTRRRIPLIIDTPLGNADSQYRPRLLKALTSFADIDQVIILTHDKEVTPDLVKLIDANVNQKMLVEFDQKTRASIIHRDFFFESAV